MSSVLDSRLIFYAQWSKNKCIFCFHDLRPLINVPDWSDARRKRSLDDASMGASRLVRCCAVVAIVTAAHTAVFVLLGARFRSHVRAL